MEREAEIIERVVGQKPRSFDTGYPGADTNLPSACVELENGDLLFLHADSEAEAISALLAAVRRRYPLAVERVEATL